MASVSTDSVHKVAKDIASTSSNDITSTDSSARPASKPTPHSIIVNKRQKGNPILKFIRNVPWEFGEIVPDYELGRCNCACFLSLRYHNRYPEYIHTRLKELGKSYDLRIILALNDTKQLDVSHELNQLAKICLLADCTLIVAFSAEEAARYIEVYKAYENKPPTDIMPKVNKDYLSQATDCLTSIKGVNKTDITTLLTHFKSIAGIIQADIDQLSLCAGIGPMKAQRLYKAFTQPFVRDRSRAHVSGTAAAKPPADKDVTTLNPAETLPKSMESTTKEDINDHLKNPSSSSRLNDRVKADTENLSATDSQSQQPLPINSHDASPSKKPKTEGEDHLAQLDASLQTFESDSDFGFSDCE